MFVKVRSFKLASYNTSMLYKRAFRKGKEVITFLIKVLKGNLATKVEAPSQLRGIDAHCSVAQ